jgi:hypothetical protein
MSTSHRFRHLLYLGTFLTCSLLLAVAGESPKSGHQYVITRDPQAIAIAESARVGMGGQQADLLYQDSLASGVLTVYGGGESTTYPITLKTKGTRESRIEVQKSHGTNVRICNHGRAVVERPNGVLKRLLENNTAAEYVNHIPLLSILSDYENGTSIQLLDKGTTQLKGQATHRIAISFVPAADLAQGSIYASMTETLFYINESTHLVDGIKYNSYAENDPSSKQDVQMYFSQYRNINGILVPFHFATYVDGTLESDVVLKSIVFNVGLSESDFTLPE